MKISTLILLLFLCVNSKAKTQKFNPLATINSHTLEKYKFAFTRTPMGNINSNFVSSALNFGVFSRLELGTVPLFYTSPDHISNYNFKILIWNGEVTKWSLSGAELKFKTEIELDEEVEKTEIEMRTIHLGVNIHIPDSPLVIGLAAAQSCGYIDSKDVFVRIFSQRCEDETGFDLQYEFRNDQWITIGQGRYREAGLTPFESVQNGYGIAYSLFRAKKLFSRPSVGVYQAEGGDTLFLLTTTFNEE